MLKKGDIILVSVLILLVAIGFGWQKLYKSINSDTNRVAVIKQNDKVLKRINLDKLNESQKYQVDGEYSNTILIEKGRIRFHEADCPDLVCVKSGWLTQKGDMAVCLPNRVSIKIEGENDSVDGVTF